MNLFVSKNCTVQSFIHSNKVIFIYILLIWITSGLKQEPLDNTDLRIIRINLSVKSNPNLPTFTVAVLKQQFFRRYIYSPDCRKAKEALIHRARNYPVTTVTTVKLCFTFTIFCFLLYFASLNNAVLIIF